jgi:hypothetical protein
MGKAGAFPRVELLKGWKFVSREGSLTDIHLTRLERLATDKRSSLLLAFGIFSWCWAHVKWSIACNALAITLFFSLSMFIIWSLWAKSRLEACVFLTDTTRCTNVRLGLKMQATDEHSSLLLLNINKAEKIRAGANPKKLFMAVIYIECLSLAGLILCLRVR